MNNPPVVPATICVAASKDDYTQYLHRKRSLIQKACKAGAELADGFLMKYMGRDHVPVVTATAFGAALCEVLVLKIDAELAELAKPQPERPGIDPEALIHAQTEVQAWQERIDMVRAAAAGFPPELGLSAMWEAILIPMAEKGLRDAEQQRDWIQQALENQQPGE
jgi:hypothetical protein